MTFQRANPTNTYFQHLKNYELMKRLILLITSCFILKTTLFSQRDGTIDSTFGINGRVLTSFKNENFYLSDVVIQSDGKIIVGGYSGLDKGLIRYNMDGSLDNNFGISSIKDPFSDSKSIRAFTLGTKNDIFIVTDAFDTTNCEYREEIMKNVGILID